MRSYPQEQMNIAVPRKPPLDSLPGFQRKLAEAVGRVGDEGRVIVRYSGTERKARVMVEGSSPVEIREIAEDLIEALKREIT